MRGLLRRLSEVDSEAEAALRIIATFDALIQHRASLDALARTTAGLVQCPVGIALVEDESCIRVDSRGRSLEATSPAESASEVVVAGEIVAYCWLERHGAAEPYDEIVLERLVVACASLWRESGAAHHAAAVDIVISTDATEIDRNRALRHLGFEAATPLRVIAFAGRGTPLAALDPGRRAEVHRALQRHTPARTTVVGPRGVALVEGHWPLPNPVDGVGLGIGSVVPAVEAPRSWFEARAVLDLSLSLPLLMGFVASVESAGALIALAAVPAQEQARNPDVRALKALSGSRDEDLQCLEAFLATGSLRAAGRLLHRHHSSVANRLARVEEALGIDLGSPRGLARAYTALALLRLGGREDATRVVLPT